MAVTTTQKPKRYLLSGAGLSAFLMLVHTTNDAFTSMLAALLPTLQVRFSLTETTLALLVATLSFSSSVTQPFFGALSDRLGRRIVGAIGVFLSSALLSLIGIVPSIFVLFGVLFLGGLGSAAFHPAGTSLARDAGSQNKGLAVSLFSFGGTIGLAIGPVVILYVIANLGLGFTPWLMIPGVILGGLMYLVVPPQKRAQGAQRPKLFDLGLFMGPVGILCLSGILRSIPFVTFINAIPLWLVTIHGIPRDDVLIGYAIGAFSFAAGIGGVIGGALEHRMSHQSLITGTMLLALLPLFAVFWLEPGSTAFYAMVVLAGALVNAGLPLMVVSAQDFAPHAVGTASGMLMGFTWGTAGVLYIGIGRLQEVMGLTMAMSLSYLALIPGAFLAYYVLQRYRSRTS